MHSASSDGASQSPGPRRRRIVWAFIITLIGGGVAAVAGKTACRRDTPRNVAPTSPRVLRPRPLDCKARFINGVCEHKALLFTSASAKRSLRFFLEEATPEQLEVEVDGQLLEPTRNAKLPGLFSVDIPQQLSGNDGSLKVFLVRGWTSDAPRRLVA